MENRSAIITSIRDSGLFDPDYYMEMVKADWSVCDPVEHFVDIGAGSLVHPSRAFDIKKYMALYPDSAATNPLYHYLARGRYAGHKLYGVDDEFDAGGLYAPLKISGGNFYNIKYDKKRIAVFAAYSKDYRIPDYVVHYLEELAAVTDAIIFVADNYLPSYELDKIRHLVSWWSCGHHGEYDFGSWKIGINAALDSNLLNKTEQLILCNDSCYAPVYAFEKLFAAMDADSCDFWGITNSREVKKHIQSYFLVFKRDVIRDEAFQNYFASVTKQPTVQDVILTYETELADFLISRGYKGRALLDTEECFPGRSENLTKYPLTLLRRGSPLIKRKNLVDIVDFDKESIFDTLRELKKINPALHHIIAADTQIFTKYSPEKAAFTIVFYHDGEFAELRKSLDSAFSQTWPNFEIIVIAEPDEQDLPRKLNELYGSQLENGNLRLRINAEFAGKAKSFNIGLQMANNDWVCFFASGVFLKKEFLEYYAIAIINNEKQRFFHSAFVKNDHEAGENLNIDLLGKDDDDCIESFVVSRQHAMKIGGFAEKLSSLENDEFILRYARDGKAIFIPMPLAEISQKDALDKTELFLARDYIAKIRSGSPVITSIIFLDAEVAAVPVLEGAIRQSGDFIHEIIVIPGGCRKIAEEYAQKYPGLLVNIVTEENWPEAIRKALALANGDYIALLHAPDYWNSPWHLQNLQEFMAKNHDCALCASGSSNLAPDGLHVEKAKNSLRRKLEISRLLANPSAIPPLSALFVKAIVLKNMPPVAYENGLSSLNLLLYCANFSASGFAPQETVINFSTHNKDNPSQKIEKLETALNICSREFKEALREMIAKLENDIDSEMEMRNAG